MNSCTVTRKHIVSKYTVNYKSNQVQSYAHCGQTQKSGSDQQNHELPFQNDILYCLD